MTEDRESSDKIYQTHDLIPKPNNFFKNYKLAKKILTKVAFDFYAKTKPNESTQLFESFMKGELRPRFVTKLKEVGYFPDITAGCYFITILVDQNDNENVRFAKWNSVLASIQPSTGDYFNRTLMRIYLDYYNRAERAELEAEAQAELEAEADMGVDTESETEKKRHKHKKE